MELFDTHCHLDDKIYKNDLENCIKKASENSVNFLIQEKWFIKQLKVADDLKLPIIFHERDSKSRLLDILKDNTKNKRNGVIHCFSGSLDEAREYIDLGLYIGITGILTIQKRGRTLRQIVKKIPINKIVIETDAPYLTPAPQKNKRKK